jgi:hypothetical protein
MFLIGLLAYESAPENHRSKMLRLFRIALCYPALHQLYSPNHLTRK